MEEYVITDGGRFVRQNVNNKYEFTYNLSLADRYNCITANQILKNCLSKSKSIGFGVAKVVDGEVGKIVIPEHTVKKKPTKRDTKQTSTVKKSIAKNMFNNVTETSGKYWMQKITPAQNLRTEALERKTNLMDLRDKINDYECDMMHYIEFCPLNCRDGYKAYATLRKILQARRRVKDELDVTEYILDQYPQEFEDSMAKLQNRIKGKDGRQYDVRQCKSLFEDGIKDDAVVQAIDEFVGSI